MAWLRLVAFPLLRLLRSSPLWPCALVNRSWLLTLMQGGLWAVAVYRMPMLCWLFLVAL